MFLPCVLCLGAVGVLAIPDFLNRIPNGRFVPDPCDPGRGWGTVGHSNTWGGKHALNAFGEDFRNERFMWTTVLCMKDSDGDRMTNGVELGDPDCRWKYGQQAARGNISHPGIVCATRTVSP
ncbi:temptin-like [Haliotis cracherodii]|uniref:temptin-like n=1 Tax=Haliotis cracherodii TaxID=6455 RepID=UPI0039EB8259